MGHVGRGTLSSGAAVSTPLIPAPAARHSSHNQPADLVMPCGCTPWCPPGKRHALDEGPTCYNRRDLRLGSRGMHQQLTARCDGSRAGKTASHPRIRPHRDERTALQLGNAGIQRHRSCDRASIRFSHFVRTIRMPGDLCVVLHAENPDMSPRTVTFHRSSRLFGVSLLSGCSPLARHRREH